MRSERWEEFKKDPCFDGPEERAREILLRHGIANAEVRRETSRNRKSGSHPWRLTYMLTTKFPQKGNKPLMEELASEGWSVMFKQKRRTDEFISHMTSKKNQYVGYEMDLHMRLIVRDVPDPEQED